MRMSKRVGGTVVSGILMLAILVPSASAVAPGRTTQQRVRCDSGSHLEGRWGNRYWQVTFTLKNNRNQRTMVYGSWYVDGLPNRTVRHRAELAAGAKEIFYSDGTDGSEHDEPPTIDRLRCRYS